ncbi:hypothetical protein PCANC_05109 [Puccinia coronata f. sp. avenae]|uniref:Uncharacterized protein n=1 Tax=Puccinia coronata f. sp. avenae TaxID=200324 RepID=A0A2N5W375_9BASI|nr:hypothetical protein PCANC_05109 [Puccinia coronata f. sp. avenae]
MVPDKVIVLKLLTILEGVALSWYKSMRLTIRTNNWTYWRQAIINKFGTSNWKRKKQLAFEKDRFVPGETAVADWVTCQYKRLIAFEPNISPESINFKIFGLVSGEVEYAAKTAMPQTGGDISTVINVLEDIVDETRLSRYRNQPRLASAQTGKPLESNKTPDKKKASKELKCWVCNTAGNTSRSCPKKINTVKTEACSESDGDDLGSDPEDPNMIIGLDLTPTLHIAHHRGRNNLVEMSCGGEPCRVLLDSGAACTAGTPVRPGSHKPLESRGLREPLGALIRVPLGTLIRVPFGTLIRGQSGTLIRVPLCPLIRVPNGTVIRVPSGTLIRVPLCPLIRVPNGTLIRSGTLIRVPLCPLIRVPNGTLIRVPNGTLIRVQSGTLIRVPFGTLIRVPLGTLIRVQSGTLIRVPFGTLIRVPLGTLIRVQSGTLIRVPLGILIRVPLGILIRVPLGTLIRVQSGTLIRVPLGILMRVPLGTLIRVPLGTLIRAPRGSRKPLNSRGLREPGRTGVPAVNACPEGVQGLHALQTGVHGQHACPAGPHAKPAVLTPFAFGGACAGPSGVPLSSPLFDFDKSINAILEPDSNPDDFSHQTDGLAERMIQTLEDMLRRYCSFGTTYKDGEGYTHDWVSLLPALEFAYNRG